MSLYLQHRIVSALKLPLRVLLNKVFRKLRGLFRRVIFRRVDKIWPRFLPYRSRPIAFNLFDWRGLRPDPALSAYATFLCAMIGQNRFNLLGSGYARPWNRDGDILDMLPPSCRARSREILALCDAGYQPIDWQRDIKSGYSWRADRWYTEQYIGPGCDIKLPWELARFQSWPQMASLLPLLAADDRARMIAAFRNQVLDFIGANPVRFGVNWVCPMDVGIRAANILLACDILKAHDQAGMLDDQFLSILSFSMREHGRFIRANLEYAENVTSNHYLSNIAGLAFLAVYLPPCGLTRRWMDFSCRELESEMGRQVQPDGTDFEASTSYHRLVGELFAYSAALLAGACGASVFSRTFWDKLFHMRDFTVAIAKPNGEVPQVGDNDSGRFFKFTPHGAFKDGQWWDNSQDHKAFIDAVAGLQGQAGSIEGQIMIRIMRGQTIDAPPARIFLPVEEIAFSSKISAAYAHRSVIRIPHAAAMRRGLNCYGYPDFGLYVFKSDELYLAVSCGHNGQNGLGGHAHNDKLSIEVNAHGQDIIVDPGSYLYTVDPAIRDLYRSTMAHSTPVVEGQEQNPISPAHPFYMKDVTKAACLHFSAQGFIGRHEGYGAPVTRRITIMNDHIVIDDYCDRPFVVNFNMPFGRTDMVDGESVTFTSVYSPAYGVAVERA